MQQRYKLLHIFYNFDTGGAQKRLEYFINYTSDVFDHYIMALNDDYTHFLSGNMNAQKYPVTYHKGRIFKNICNLRKAYQKLQPNCILTQNFGTLEAVIANTPQLCPHIHNEDGFGSDEQTQLKWRRNWLRKFFLIGKTLIVPSQNLLNIAQSNWHFSNSNMHYIANGVPEFGPYSECPFDNRGKFTIGTVAICRPEKNLKLFIQTIASLKSQGQEIFGVLVGDGSELEALKTYAQSLKLTQDDIYFAGYQENYRVFMAYFDLFMLTSYTEQQPLGVLDAMAAGLPIVATSVGDIKKMVSHDNNSYISDHIFVNEAHKLVDLIANHPLRSELGRQNFQKFQQEFKLETSLQARKQIILSAINCK